MTADDPRTDPAGTVRAGAAGEYVRLYDPTDAQRTPWLRIDGPGQRGPLPWVTDAAVAGLEVLGAVPADAASTALAEAEALLWAHTAPDAYLLGLATAGRLGYLAAADEWTDGDQPLPAPLQDAADQLLAAGQLPEFAGFRPGFTITAIQREDTEHR